MCLQLLHVLGGTLCSRGYARHQGVFYVNGVPMHGGVKHVPGVVPYSRSYTQVVLRDLFYVAGHYHE